jgi:hypothetical protein
MTPAERALLVAMAEVIHMIRPDLHLHELIQQVRAEDLDRADRMPAMSREARRERQSR